MHGKEEVELFLLAREDGMSIRDAAEFAGVCYGTARGWVLLGPPRSYTGRPWGSGRARMGSPEPRGKAPAMGEKTGLYEPPASGPLAGLTPDQIENLLLRAVLADLKAGGWDPASISNGSECELGERLRRETGLPLRSITAFLRISKSSYEYHRARLGRDRDAALRPLVREAFGAGRGCYGYRRVHAELRRRGVRVSEKVVRRVMAEEGLEARRPRRRRYSSYAGEEGRACAPNLPLLDAARDLHEFRAPSPGRVFSTDISEMRLPDDARRLYVSPLVDLYDGRVAAVAVATSPGKALVRDMLLSAAPSFRGGVVLHSDRGWHYRTPEWVGLCGRLGVVRSLSRKGHSPDNAVCEGFFGRMKEEMLRGRDWSGATVEDLSAEVLAYVEWYNSGRLKRFGDGYDTIDGRRSRLGLGDPPSSKK